MGRQIVFREVPDQISLSYMIAGCRVRCQGCHSVDSWNPEAGQPLTLEDFRKDLDKYRDWITCVLFMGGEWHHDELLSFLRLAQQRNLKTALYTGQELLSASLVANLDYLKLGPYKKECGGLDSPLTNQKFIEVKTGRILNSQFHQPVDRVQEEQHDSPQ